MARKKASKDVPIDAAGDQWHWLPWNMGDIVMQDNFVFTDTLVFEHYESNVRSSGYFKFTRKSTGTKVTMFASDFNLVAKDMVKGELEGTWTFIKHGRNYGTTRVDLLDPED